MWLFVFWFLPLWVFGFSYVIQETDPSNATLTLQNGSVWKLNYWYQGVLKTWKAGDSLQIYCDAKDPVSLDNFELENIETAEVSWATLQRYPIVPNHWILRKSTDVFSPEGSQTVVLEDGSIFSLRAKNWKMRDSILVFQQRETAFYTLLNVRANEFVFQASFLGNENEGHSASIVNLENNLNARVLGQKEAIGKVCSQMVSSWVGLRDLNKPVGVFLFLGPTGVGKTELAKALARELFAGDQHLIRFDMAQFSEYHTISRLIGSPPGYVGYEQGGQLTEALKRTPHAVILLDEVEKAHEKVLKSFLSVFDEGYITDSFNQVVPCQNAIFILTSNLASQEITKWSQQGYSSEEILEKIEPLLINHLSPELYNRVTPVVFSSLEEQVMRGLVELMLAPFSQQLLETKNLHLVLSERAKKYLIEMGFDPKLGARPLKRLINQKIIGAISKAILEQSIPEGASVHLLYLEREDRWKVTWSR